MGSSLGRALTDLTEGDVVSIEVDGSRYSGRVTEIERTRGKLMSDTRDYGHVAIRLNLDAEMTNGSEQEFRELLVRATEEVPLAWSRPTASAHDPAAGEPVRDLGAVSDVQSR